MRQRTFEREVVKIEAQEDIADLRLARTLWRLLKLGA